MLEELNKRSGAITIDRDIVEHFQSKKDYMDYLNEFVFGNFTRVMTMIMLLLSLSHGSQATTEDCGQGIL